MNALRDYVDWKLAHSDKVAEAEGYPLVLEKCKKNKKMKELKVYGNSVQDGTPTPESPIEIQSVGEKSKNLFNATCEVVNTTNSIICKGSVMIFNSTDSSSNYGIKTDASSYITLKAGVTYTVSTTYLSGRMTSGEFVCGLFDVNTGTWYKINSSIIYAPTLYANTYTDLRSKSFTPDVDVTVCFRVYAQNVATDLSYGVMIYEGSELIPYEPYGKYKIPIVQRGKNFIAFDDRSISGATNLESNEHDATWRGNISTATSQYIASAGWVRFGFKTKKTIKLLEGVPITISVDVTPLERHDETRDTATRLTIYANESDKSISQSPIFSMDLGVKSHLVYTLTPRARFGETINVIVYLCSHTMKIENFQVEYGSTDTPYEPYVEPTTHNVFVDEPLSANDVLDVKEHMELPKLTAKTTVFTTDTTTPPSKMYGKYIKR